MAADQQDSFVVTAMHPKQKDHFWLARPLLWVAVAVWLACIISGTLERGRLGELFGFFLLGGIVSTGVALRVTSLAADERRRARNRL